MRPAVCAAIDAIITGHRRSCYILSITISYDYGLRNAARYSIISSISLNSAVVRFLSASVGGRTEAMSESALSSRQSFITLTHWKEIKLNSRERADVSRTVSGHNSR